MATPPRRDPSRRDGSLRLASRRDGDRGPSTRRPASGRTSGRGAPRDGRRASSRQAPDGPLPRQPRRTGQRTGSRRQAPQRSWTDVLAAVIAAIITFFIAVGGAIASGVSSLFGGRRRGPTFSRPRTGRVVGSSLSRRPTGGSFSSYRSYGGSQASVPGIALRVCAGIAVIGLLGAFTFATPAGVDPTAEQGLMDMQPLELAEIPISTPRSEWTAGEMPHLYQIDPLWSSLPYAGGTVRANACGPTCMTMVYVYLTGDTSLDPGSMAALADAGNYAPTGSTEWRFMTEGAAELGITGTGIRPVRSAVTEALEGGNPVIVSVGPGDFTTLGHFIVLKDIDENGMLTVYDPNSSLRSARKWGIAEVLRQANMCWAFSA